MTGLESPGVLDRLSLSSPQQRLFRAAVMVAALLFIGLVPTVAGTFSLLFSVVAVVLAVLAALLPESNAPLALVLGLGVLWLRSVPHEVDVWTLVAAMDLAVVHVACTLASYGPPGLVLDRPFLGRWARRLVLCLGAAALTWVASKTLASLDLPPSRLVLAAALAAFLAWAGFLAVRLARPHAG